MTPNEMRELVQGTIVDVDTESKALGIYLRHTTWLATAEVCERLDRLIKIGNDLIIELGVNRSLQG